MAKIAIDADGVLSNFTASFVEMALRLYPGRVSPDWVPQQWDYTEVFSADEQDAIWRKIRGTQNWWLGLDAYSAEVGSLARWLIRESDHDVYVVTSREPTKGMTVAKQTDWWLLSCGIHPINNYLGVIVVPESSKKAGVYRAAEFDFSIDDKASTVEQCDQMKGSHRAYLLDRPWNQGAKVERRVKSVEQFLKEIK